MRGSFLHNLALELGFGQRSKCIKKKSTLQNYAARSLPKKHYVFSSLSNLLTLVKRNKQVKNVIHNKARQHDTLEVYNCNRSAI